MQQLKSTSVSPTVTINDYSQFVLDTLPTLDNGSNVPMFIEYSRMGCYGKVLALCGRAIALAGDIHKPFPELLRQELVDLCSESIFFVVAGESIPGAKKPSWTRLEQMHAVKIPESSTIQTVASVARHLILNGDIQQSFMLPYGNSVEVLAFANKLKILNI